MLMSLFDELKYILDIQVTYHTSLNMIIHLMFVCTLINISRDGNQRFN